MPFSFAQTRAEVKRQEKIMKKSVKKKRRRGFKIFSVILSILLLASIAFMLWQLYVLKMLPLKLFIPAAAIVLLIGLILVIAQLYCTYKTFSKIVISFLTIAAFLVTSIGGLYLYQTNGLVQAVTSSGDTISSTVEVIAMNSSSLNDENDLQGVTVGTLSSISTAATQALVGELEERGITVWEQSYDSVQELAAALYSGEVPAVIMTASTKANLADLSEDSSENPYVNIASETKVVYSMVYTAQKQVSTAAVSDITNTPFTVYISGSDSRVGFEETGRSDVNMLVTVNPETRVILMTSIPRDYYVTTICDAGLGCLYGQMDKLTHVGLHGTEASKATIENLLDVEINYTVKVNFNSVVSLVDALGGINVFVQQGYAVDSFWTNSAYGVTEGVNHLNGEAALAYARERYAYTEGDRQRVLNQQQVLKAVLQEAMSPSILANYSSFVSALSGAFETDISAEEIQSLVKMQLTDGSDWSFVSYSLDGYGSTEYCAELGQAAYVMVPDENTIETAREKIEAVIDGQSAMQVETDEAVE
jgi:LCP family protein required for cell wall assembly